MSVQNNVSPSTINVWYRRTGEAVKSEMAEAEGPRLAMLRLLSDDERERYQKLKVAAARENYLAAHVMLRNALSQRAAMSPDEWRFETGAHGKPLIANAGYREKLTFSLSHTQGLVACAVAIDPVLALGVDVECLDRKVDWEPLANRYYAAKDLAWIAGGDASERRERFFRLWTLKEAYLKATGEGFSQPLSSFNFDFADPLRPQLLRLSEPPLIKNNNPRTANCDWFFFESQPVPNCVLATAAAVGRGTIPRVLLHDATDLTM